MPLLRLCYPVETIQSSEPVSGTHSKDKINNSDKNQNRKMASGCEQTEMWPLDEVIKKESVLPVWFSFREKINEGF